MNPLYALLPTYLRASSQQRRAQPWLKKIIQLVQAEAHGRAYFVAHEVGGEEHAEEYAQVVWPMLVRDSPDVGVYLFDCLICKRPVLRWDLS